MITQETKPVKTWGRFNLAILKVNLNPLSWKNRSSYNKTYKPPCLTSYYYPPVELTDTTTCKLRIHGLLLSWIHHRYKHPRLFFFRIQWQQLSWSSRCRWHLLLENPKLCVKKSSSRSHKRFTQNRKYEQQYNSQAIKTLERFGYKTLKYKRGTLISLFLVSKTWFRVSFI